jgi:hypothetical protein
MARADGGVDAQRSAAMTQHQAARRCLFEHHLGVGAESVCVVKAPSICLDTIKTACETQLQKVAMDAIGRVVGFLDTEDAAFKPRCGVPRRAAIRVRLLRLVFRQPSATRSS